MARPAAKISTLPYQRFMGGLQLLKSKRLSDFHPMSRLLPPGTKPIDIRPGANTYAASSCSKNNSPKQFVCIGCEYSHCIHTEGSGEGANTYNMIFAKVRMHISKIVLLKYLPVREVRIQAPQVFAKKLSRKS